MSDFDGDCTASLFGLTGDDDRLGVFNATKYIESTGLQVIMDYSPATQPRS